MKLEVEFVQLRDKNVEAGELYAAAERWRQVLAGSGTKLLVNHRGDVAVAAKADGVHLTAREDELCVPQVHEVFDRAGRARPIVTVSCHTLREVRQASEADLILFGPVFEKRVGGEVVVAGVGLEKLREACEASRVPVLALGGVSEALAGSCVEAGAAGVAGIRMFG
jgi:thiamine-phosphate pyrophosphorylase